MIIPRMIFKTFPAVKEQLAGYTAMLNSIDGPLAEQGLASIRDKEFHCLGGSVYALLAPGGRRRDVLSFIVAFQTISDYLDNLCDRFGIKSEQVFRQIHTAMLDSLKPGGGYSEYYSLFPYKDDGGYLGRLVDDCRDSLGRLPGYSLCREQIVQLTELYIHLQSYKHMEHKAGEELLAALYSQHQEQNPNLHWWEFAAACGSTLGVFTLVAAGHPRQFYGAYMPWVNGLHILLDYYIDQDEDIQHGDMNLVSYYDNPQYQQERLLWFYQKASRAVSSLENYKFHSLVIDGLLAMYLSDSKAWSEDLAPSTRGILKSAGLRACGLERMARLLRGRGVI